VPIAGLHHMSNSSRARPTLPPQLRVIRLLSYGWIGVVLLSLALNSLGDWRQSVELARMEAGASLDKDLLYRRWASRHGGVYVPPTDLSPPNPYLKDIRDRDVVTTVGKALTLVNPAYMTRQVYEMAQEQKGAQGHITSLKPLRPENKPDAWEAEALTSFEKGAGFATAIVDQEGSSFLRLMRPMRIEASCLKCHGHQGYREGDIRGGLSVTVPMQPYHTMAARHIAFTGLAHLVLGGLGLIGLWLSERRQKSSWQALREAEVALLESERRYRSLLNGVQLFSVMLDAKGRVTYANEALLRKTGWAKDEVLGHDWFDRFVPAGTDVRQIFVDSLSSGLIPVTLENEILTRAGERRLIAWSNTLLREEQGIIIGTASLGEDITERAQTESKLREQAALLNVASDAIIVVDPRGLIQFWNRGAELIYGWSPEDVQGRDLRALLYDGDHPPPLAARQAILNRGSWHGELTQVRKDGSVVTVRASGVLMQDREGRPRSLLLTASDITEEKRLEGRLLHSQRLETLGAIAGGVAHDLNNVLTPLLIAADSLRPLAREPGDHEIVQLVHDSARRGAEIVQQLLLFSRNRDAPRTLLQPEFLLHELERLIRETFPKNITVSVTTEPDMWEVEANQTKLHQVLLNLCVNARDAMPAGGGLSVTATKRIVDAAAASRHEGASPGAYVAFQVTDTGTGITAADLEKIFDPFYTTKPAGKGTGLGLPAVLGITKAHEGFVVVESLVGEGSSFTVFLPARIETHPVAPTPLPKPYAAGRGEQVLIVDDESIIRSSLERLLGGANYRTLVAADGAAALELLQQHGSSLHLVITDMMMPVMDGCEFLQRLRQIAPQLPVLVMSGGARHSPAELQKMIGGRMRFLTKPFLSADVLTLAREILDEPPPGPS
jgi:two-component system cell cycle sensor histidine kinase/response regulator CckA